MTTGHFYNDDLFIVEFPKSGITWLSNILANTIVLKNNLSLDVTHFNLEQFIGDIHVSNNINRQDKKLFPGYRLIKSHNEYTSSYRHVIYLIRNPFSVMQSYYFYAQGNGFFSGELQEFIRDKRYGVDSWCKHVDSWVCSPKRKMKMHIIKYEELQDDSFSTISTLYSNLGWKIEEEHIKTSIEKSSFKEMKKSEELFKAHCPHRRYSFVREGKKYTKLDNDSREYIAKKTKNILLKLYPEL